MESSCHISGPGSNKRLNMAGELAGMFKSVSFESMAPAGAIDSNAKANDLKRS